MMTTSKAINIFLALFITGVFALPFLSSCGKTGIVSGAGSNTQLQVLNLSPDVGPVDLYADFIKQNPTSFIYTFPAAYFFVSPGDTLLQVRTAQASSVSIVSLDTMKFLSNHKYSLFITGRALNAAATYPIGYIYTLDDTASVPNVGFGKIRLVNASMQASVTGSIDVKANGTVAFSAIKYKKVSPYIQLPAGSYNFQVNVTGSPNSVLATPNVQAVTIQDGRLYTLYTYGIVGQTDTSAFNAAVITNR